jgi:hypothetical protein
MTAGQTPRGSCRHRHRTAAAGWSTCARGCPDLRSRPVSMRSPIRGRLVHKPVPSGAQVSGPRHEENARVSAHIVYLVGGAPRVGKSVLAQRLLATDRIPWLPTDVIRTVVRRVVPDVDAADQDPVDATALSEVMYPHIEQAAQVCAAEADRFLIEGFELAPSYPVRLRAALAGTEILRASLGTVPSRLKTSLGTGDRSPSPSATCHPGNCASRPAGSAAAAGSCASSATPCACHMWTLGRRVRGRDDRGPAPASWPWLMRRWP